MARSRVELFEQVRRDRRIEWLSIRDLAERHRVHRRTVGRALASALPPPRKTYPRRPRPAVDVEVIDGWLLADRDVPRKQRHTARRIWQRIVAEHGAGLAEVTVSRYVAGRRVELGLDRVQVAVPQTHPPGGRDRSRLRRVPRPRCGDADQAVDVRDAVVALWPGVPRRVCHPGPQGLPGRACAGVRPRRCGAGQDPLRQPQARGGPALLTPRLLAPVSPRERARQHRVSWLSAQSSLLGRLIR
jgi:hypothetical protein